MHVQSNCCNYAPIFISNTVRAEIIYLADSDTVNSRFLMSLLEAFCRWKYQMYPKRISSSAEASGKADFVFYDVIWRN